MTDKDNSRYYEPYPTLTVKQNNTNSLKRNEIGASIIKGGSSASSSIHNPTNKQSNRDSSSSNSSKCCCCSISARSSSFWASFLTNLGICTLLFGYTLLGEFVICIKTTTTTFVTTTQNYHKLIAMTVCFLTI